MKAKTETKLWQMVKTNTPKIRWNRLENSISRGMPDLIGSVAGGHFFTVELKITRDNKTISFSPHQIAFHKVNHGLKFIMISTVDLSPPKLFHSSLANEPRPSFGDHSPLAEGFQQIVQTLTRLSLSATSE
tara:strand:- start:492 stop:884 length:393 start_codon:yes stop_codon:yes gene_type:complete